MNTQFLAGIAFFGLCLSVSVSTASAGNFLIVPGKSIGQTVLGPNGAAELKRLPAPAAEDNGMMQTHLVWVSRTPGDRNTLYLHGISNSVYDNVNPANGMTINEIRITSRQFHTRSGISTASTLAEVRRRFPAIRPVCGTPGLFEDTPHGIAFEFAQPVTPESRCIGISVVKPLPGGSGSGVTTQSDVDRLLNDSRVR